MKPKRGVLVFFTVLTIVLLAAVIYYSGDKGSGILLRESLIMLLGISAGIVAINISIDPLLKMRDAEYHKKLEAYEELRERMTEYKQNNDWKTTLQPLLLQRAVDTTVAAFNILAPAYKADGNKMVLEPSTIHTGMLQNNILLFRKNAENYRMHLNWVMARAGLEETRHYLTMHEKFDSLDALLHNAINNNGLDQQTLQHAEKQVNILLGSTESLMTEDQEKMMAIAETTLSMQTRTAEQMANKYKSTLENIVKEDLKPINKEQTVPSQSRLEYSFMALHLAKKMSGNDNRN